MDLFPKDYKKNDAVTVPPTGDKPSLASVLNKAKEKLSSFKQSSSELSLAPKAKGTLLRLGVIVSGGALILSLLLWGSLVIYKNVLTGQINDLKKKQSEVFNEKDKEIAAKIVELEKGSVLVQGLLKTHLYASGAFDKLAETTIPRVQWQSFDLGVADRIINLKGFSADYATLAKQILALDEGGFTNVKIGNISLDKSGGVGFSATFNFDSKILQKQ